MSQVHLTVGEVAKIFDAPAWKVRRVVDELAPNAARAGNYRLIPRDLLGAIAEKLRGSKSDGGSPCS